VRAVLPWAALALCAYLLGTFVVAPMMVGAAGLRVRRLVSMPPTVSSQPLRTSSAHPTVQVQPAAPAPDAADPALAPEHAEQSTQTPATDDQPATAAQAAPKHRRHHRHHAVHQQLPSTEQAPRPDPARDNNQLDENTSPPDRGQPIDGADHGAANGDSGT
jgi:hypothetical protein